MLAVEELLSSYIKNDIQKISQDYIDEFTTYWQGEFFAYIKSWKLPLQALLFDRQSIFDNAKKKIKPEIIIFNCQTECDSWLKSRGAINNTHNKVTSVIVIELKQLNLIDPFEKWPLTSRQEFFIWLKTVDSSAAQSFVSKLLSVINNSIRSVYVILKTHGGNVGAFIKFDKQVIEALRRSQNKHLRKKGHKPTSPNSILLRKNAINKESFFRFDVEDASDSRITTRNQETEVSLVGKKIALIGCGTVGSFTAMLLTQLGAGVQDHTHRGKLSLLVPN